MTGHMLVIDDLNVFNILHMTGHMVVIETLFPLCTCRYQRQ
jgi:hypothetical protein